MPLPTPRCPLDNWKARCCVALGVVTTSKVGASGGAPETRQTLRTMPLRSVSRRVEALDLAAIVEGLGVDLAQRRLGPRGRRDGVTRRLGVLVFVTEQQGPPRLEHVPQDVVGEHAHEDVGPDPMLKPVVDGPDLEVDGLERAKRALDLGESLIAAHGLLGGYPLLGETRAEDIDPIKCRLGGDSVRVDVEVEASIFDGEPHVLGRPCTC